MIRQLQPKRLLAPNVEVDVYNTHKEAGGTGEDDAERVVQVDELLATMARYSDGRPIICLTDTNLRPSDPADAPTRRPSRACLLADGDLIDACDAVMCPEPGRSDQVLLRSLECVELTATSWSVEPIFYEIDEEPLSDHDVISATIEWRIRP